MGFTSNETKQSWNNKHYTQVKISVQPEIAADFKMKCLARNVSMASEISKFMSANAHISEPYKTRPKRRKALLSMIKQLEAICDAETTYLENIPANLQNSQAYDAAEHSVSVIEEAISCLSQAY